MNYKKRQLSGFGSVFIIMLVTAALSAVFLYFIEQSSDAGIEERYRTARLMLWSIGILAPVLLAAAILLMRRTIRGTTNKLKNITGVMRSADFNTSENLPRLNSDSEDEIGNIALSFNEMAISLESHNRRSRELKEELEEHTWIQTALAESSALYQNIGSMEQLAATFLRKIVPLSGAAYAVFYSRRGEDELVRIASYSDYAAESSVDTFKIGQGLVGRAALSGESVLLEDLPEHYLRITSGLGEAAPRSLFIVPVQFEQRVEAVVEFASLTTFTPVQRRLVEQLMNTLGIAINAVTGRMQVDSLLRDSQLSAEELQSQTEELQAQSEELRTQQETLRTANRELEKTNLQVEEKNRLLEVVQQELIRSAQFQTEFLANMSHELRTPLNSILILSQILSEKDNETLTQQEKEYAATIYRSGHDLLGLIDDILDLAKAEAGKMEVTAEPYNLTELSQSMKGLFDEIARKKGIRFDTIFEPDTLELLWTDGRRLEQIVKNLLSNAIKFTTQGSVTLRIASADLPNSSNGEAGVKIEVADTGIGISDDKKDLIFEAFLQADGATERRYGGTGLGLSICREFSRLLGGSIGLESASGHGSVFTLYLPSDLRHVHQPDAEATTALPEPSTSLASNLHLPREQEGDRKLFEGRRLLLVDDDARNIYAISVALESKGAEVGIAENGREALDVLERDPAYDLVLMDIMMPLMDGYETMKAIRAKPEFGALPIIVLTAKAMKDEREMCLEAGASDYISKPLNIEKLFSLMRVWLAR
ncbi:ATP-binding protein [Saccharibacillus kuerlensis]|uniref:histidine kinase n=1 Tax=Saccharibacillus kuerlensis TaxID=459527 RepID=A0ABQ2L2P5_9BACL|nr:ATP-binding protein [Saccharibacillus kuerlensis]GGO00567.1 histidine kinase [Saccharibacillus kuerlensis]